MRPKNVPPHRSASNQSVGRFFSKTVAVLGKWQKEQREAEKRALANARFPWRPVLLLFGIHSIAGFVLATLQGAWAIVAWILIVSTSLYCTLLAISEGDDFIFGNFASALLWQTLALPWTATVEQMDAVLRRQVLNTFRHDLAIDFWCVMARIFCLITLVGLDSLGVWAGYTVSTQV
ncbi:MAG TPA: hypothetical protein V6D29_05830 [Leptolyngbyaceae cyanobacterium]